MSKPSAGTVIATVALLVALSGAGMAATGGNFILGKQNAADATSSLSSPVAGSALQVANSSTASGATALALTAANGHAPFTVNSDTKVTRLNADKLDGVDSTGFVQGNGRFVSNHFTMGDDGVERTLLVLPRVGKVQAVCSLTSGIVESQVGFLNTAGVDLIALVDQSTDPQAPGYLPVGARTTTLLFNPYSGNRRSTFELYKEDEASGPVMHITTFEAVAQGGTCYYAAWAIIRN